MAGFETKTVTAKGAPAELPDLATRVLGVEGVPEGDNAVPDGAIYRVDEHTNAEGGKVPARRFRLRHARWVEVMPRQPRKPNGTAKK